MKPAPRIYNVGRLDWPWLGGEGFLAGLPVALLSLDKDGPPIAADVIRARIEEWARAAGPSGPAWVAVLGGDRENDLLVTLRAHLSMRFYTETDGTRPMVDHEGRLPMYDHVCLRARPGLEEIRTQFFHSVIAEPPHTAERVAGLSGLLDRYAYNGPRYLASTDSAIPTPRDAALVTAAGAGWRVTRPALGACPAAVCAETRDRVLRDRAKGLRGAKGRGRARC